MKLNFTPSFRRFLGVLGIWLAVVAIAVGLDWYLFTLLQKTAVRLVEAKQKTATLGLKQSSLLKERDRLKEFDADIAKIESAFIDASNPLGFIETLEGLAKENSIVLKLDVPQKKDKTLSMRIEAVGGLQGVLAFVKKMEGLPHQVLFQDATFEKIKEAATGPTGKKVAPANKARLSGLIEFLAK
ncbi:MAG: hypothetical protein Q7S66_05835 [bacterium]|nr:hypothetical protein [bacterium]